MMVSCSRSLIGAAAVLLFVLAPAPSTHLDRRDAAVAASGGRAALPARLDAEF
jgi:hypothetical protein